MTKSVWFGSVTLQMFQTLNCETLLVASFQLWLVVKIAKICVHKMDHLHYVISTLTTVTCLVFCPHCALTVDYLCSTFGALENSSPFMSATSGT